MSEPHPSPGEIACVSLQRLVRAILARKPGGYLIEDRLPEIDLELTLVLRGEKADPAAFARRLEAAIERQIDEAIESAAAFQPGHVFCHRCAAAACEHSRPPSSRHVFIGYGATGVPAWREFAQHCLELRHPEVDRLFVDPPAFLTFVQGRPELDAALLSSFRNDGRELLGQVTAGFFRLPARAGEGRGVLALTLQAVGSTVAGRKRVGLNLLATGPEGSDLALLWERQADLPWRRAVRWAQSALATLPRGPQAERRVGGILQGLARRLEQDVKGRARRTAHADERHETGERPTRKAIDDIRAARPESFLLDGRSGAVVVLGGRGRTHFFTPEGRLVSSARYSRDAIERKRKHGVWQALDKEEAQAVRDSALRQEPPSGES